VTDAWAAFDLEDATWSTQAVDLVRIETCRAVWRRRVVINPGTQEYSRHPGTVSGHPTPSRVQQYLAHDHLTRRLAEDVSRTAW
jgi:hypothetical protein